MGYFHLKQINSKWWVATPDGRPIHMRGVNHYGDGSHLPLSAGDDDRSRAAWRASLRDRFSEWGFNYLPPSIGPSETDTEPIPPTRGTVGRPKWHGNSFRTPEWTAEQFSDLGMPFTALLAFPTQHMSRNLPDVFSKEFRAGLDKRCREFCAPLRDNPNLIGYHFCHNPSWHPHANTFLTWVHAIVDDGNEAKNEWAKLMQRIYGTVERWRETYSIPIESFDEVNDLPFPMNGNVSATNLLRDKIAFMKRVCHEWYKVYSETIRKYDPNHLIFGDRNTVHLQPLSDWAIHIMAPYIDVLSINVMGPQRVALREMEIVTANWDGPIHLADTGAGIYNGRYPKSTFMCKDIDEFEDVYSGIVRLGIEHPQVIGFGWCGYFETKSSRSGLVDAITNTPDEPKIEVVTKWNKWAESKVSVVGREEGA